MSLIDQFTADELIKFKELKEQMLEGRSSREVKYYEREIHHILNNIEQRARYLDDRGK